MAQNANARITRSRLGENRQRTVRRAVVDADDLDVLERLRADGIETFGEILLDVVDGDDDGKNHGHYIFAIKFPVSRKLT